MSRYPNQYTVRINKDYDWIDYEDLMRACRDLNGAALKLFLYLVTCDPGEEIIISPIHIKEITGISLNSEKNAFKELQLKGYLKEKFSCFFIFNPTKN